MALGNAYAYEAQREPLARSTFLFFYRHYEIYMSQSILQCSNSVLIIQALVYSKRRVNAGGNVFAFHCMYHLRCSSGWAISDA